MTEPVAAIDGAVLAKAKGSKGDVGALRCPGVRLCTLRRRCGNDTANERHGANTRILSSDSVESCTVGKSWLGLGCREDRSTTHFSTYNLPDQFFKPSAYW